jgi:2'-5' RNA ligase
MDPLATATETAVVVEVPEAEPAVREHRSRFDVAASWGVRAHVSVLYPFVPPGDVDGEVLRRLAATVGRVGAFDCTFERCAWFGEDVLWLAPDPSRPFRDLTDAVWSEFPQHPPYEDAVDDVVPHLTVAERSRGSLEELRDVERAVRHAPPITTYVDRVALIAGRPEADSWHTVQELRLWTGGR